MQRISGWVEQGDNKVTTGGLQSTTLVQESIPGATVTVYLAGTTNLATIFLDNNTIPTPLANPFVANNNGTWFFYVTNGRYDIVFSGGGLAAPFTLSDVQAFDYNQIILSVFANNAAALAGGLVPGQLYRTGSDPDNVCIVH